MKLKSLGMIETYGFTPAVVAADTGMKAANVELIACTLTPPARMTVHFNGDVAAVKTAVTAAKAAAEKVGEVISVHVIPRPVPGIFLTFGGDDSADAVDILPPYAPKPSLQKMSVTKKEKKIETPKSTQTKASQKEPPPDIAPSDSDPSDKPTPKRRRVKKKDTIEQSTPSPDPEVKSDIKDTSGKELKKKETTPPKTKTKTKAGLPKDATEKRKTTSKSRSQKKSTK